MKKKNQEATSIKSFNQYARLAQAACIGIFVMGVYLIIQRPVNIPQLFGWFFLLFGAVCAFVMGRHRSKLIWIYRNVSSISMNMKLGKEESSDSIQYFAYLADEKSDRCIRKAYLYPSACFNSLLVDTDYNVQVYNDPENSNPAVIKTAEGLLWVMAGSGSVQMQNAA